MATRCNHTQQYSNKMPHSAKIFAECLVCQMSFYAECHGAVRTVICLNFCSICINSLKSKKKFYLLVVRLSEMKREHERRHHDIYHDDTQHNIKC
jgi:hypothetical protein